MDTQKLINNLKQELIEQTCPSKNVKEAIKQLEELEAENLRLHKLLAADTQIIEANYHRDAGINVTIEHWAVRHLAASFIESLKRGRKLDEANYIIMNIDCGEIPIEVTIQKKGGTTPGQMLDKAKQYIKYFLETHPNRDTKDWNEDTRVNEAKKFIENQERH
jgi:hypothetical protein